jgi:hypothetical protein
MQLLNPLDSFKFPVKPSPLSLPLTSLTHHPAIPQRFSRSKPRWNFSQCRVIICRRTHIFSSRFISVSAVSQRSQHKVPAKHIALNIVTEFHNSRPGQTNCC